MVNASAAAIIMMSAHHRNRVRAPRRNSGTPKFVTKATPSYTKGTTASIMPNRAFNDTKILLPTRSLRHQPNAYYPPGSYGLGEGDHYQAHESKAMGFSCHGSSRWSDCGNTFTQVSARHTTTD